MTQLSDADRKFAQLLYDELEGPIANQDASRQMRQWETCVRLVPAARSARDAEREPEIAALKAENARLREEMRWCRRAAEMSARIMRDPKRTGAWEGSERVANQFDRLGATLRAALGGENG